MKRLILALILTAAALSGCSSEDEEPGISGRYVGTQNFGIGQISSAIVIQIRQRNTVITGTVTPPFRMDPVTIFNGKLDGMTFQFDARHDGTTFRYTGVVRDNQMQGNYDPLGCVDASSGQPCQTDSDGSFNTQKQ
jgi:hypothetical protein